MSCEMAAVTNCCKFDFNIYLVIFIQRCHISTAAEWSVVEYSLSQSWMATNRKAMSRSLYNGSETGLRVPFIFVVNTTDPQQQKMSWPAIFASPQTSWHKNQAVSLHLRDIPSNFWRRCCPSKRCLSHCNEWRTPHCSHLSKQLSRVSEKRTCP